MIFHFDKIRRDSGFRFIKGCRASCEKKLREGALERDIKPEYIPEEEYDEADDFRIVRTKRFSLKPMTPEEAILQMNLIGHAFYAFTDSESGETCVVYKRKAGSYGLIVPEK